jgi:hypothetical protein
LQDDGGPVEFTWVVSLSGLAQDTYGTSMIFSRKLSAERP